MTAGAGRTPHATRVARLAVVLLLAVPASGAHAASAGPPPVLLDSALGGLPTARVVVTGADPERSTPAAAQPIAEAPGDVRIAPPGTPPACPPSGGAWFAQVTNFPEGLVIANVPDCGSFRVSSANHRGDASLYGRPSALGHCGYVRRRWVADARRADGTGGCGAGRPAPQFGDHASYLASVAPFAGLLDNCAPQTGGIECRGGIPVKAPASRCPSVPVYANVQPWLASPAPSAPAVRTAAANTVFKWRYVTRDGRYALVEQPAIGGNAREYDVPWGFVDRRCLPAVLPHPIGYRNIVLPGRSASDFNSDGAPDLVARDPGGQGMRLYPGDGRGRFEAGAGELIPSTGFFAGFTSLTAAGDWNGDRVPDLLARDPAGTLFLCSGAGDGGFRDCAAVATGWSAYDLVIGAGDLNRDGHPDVIARTPGGTLFFFAGDGAAGFAAPGVRIGEGWEGYETIAGPGDWSGDGEPDLIAHAPDGSLWEWRGAGVTVSGGVPAFRSPPVQIGRRLPGYDVVAAGRWDDGAHPDLLLRSPAGLLLLYRGDGAGGFSGAGEPVGSGWRGPAGVPVVLW